MSNMLKIGSIFGVLFVMASLCFGQNNFEDVVYLKNGGVIHGMIIEQIPNKSLKIQTVGRNIFVYSIDEVERITKEAIPSEMQPKLRHSPSEVHKGRLTFILEGNLGVILSDPDSAGTKYSADISGGATAVIGFNMGQKASLGIGGGFDQIGGLSFFPIFVDCRYFFNRQKLSPYLSAGIGYALGTDYQDNNRYYKTKYNSAGGLYLNPNVGIKFNLSPRTGLNFGAGLRIQGNSGHVSSPRGNINYNYMMTFFNTKIGLIF